MTRRFPLGLALALLVYVVLRGLVLHTAFDEVGLWMYEVNPMGTLAELCLRGIRVPTHLFYDNAAGQVLGGYLAVPAFLVLGPTYLALKVVPLLMGIGTLLILYAFLLEAFGRTAAVLGAWLFALAPTALFKYSMVCSGNHFENVFFSSIVLFLFYRLHARGVTAGRLFAVGLAAGFATFVFLGAVIPVGILAGMHVGVRGLRRTARDLAALVPGFLVGIAPLLALNAWTSGRGAFYLASKFGEGDAVGSAAFARVPARIATYLFVKLPQAASYPDFAGVGGQVLSWIFAIALAAATCACLPSAVRALLAFTKRSAPEEEKARFERAKLLPMVLYLPLSALAFGLSNLVVYELGGSLGFSAYRYYLPVFLFGLLAVAAVCARGFERGGGARAGAAVLFAAALLPGISNVGLVDWSFSNTGLGSRYAGYDLSKIARVLLASKNRLEAREITGFLDTFPPLVRARVARALGFNLAVRQLNSGLGRGPTAMRAGRVDLDPLVAPYSLSDRAEIARGAGIGARFVQFSERAPLEDLVGLLARSAEEASPTARPLLPAFLEGAALPNPSLPLATRTAPILAENRAIAVLALDRTGSRALAEGIARGDGFLACGLVRRGIPRDVQSVAAALAALPSDLSPSFAEGLGAGCAEGGEEPGLPAAFPVPTEASAAFWSGFVSALRSIHGAGAPRVAAALAVRLAPEHRAALERALERE
jgi:hypothetical protein